MMESVFQRLAEVGVTKWRRRPHRVLQEEGGSPGWDTPGQQLRELPSCGSLHAARMSLRKRLPLKQLPPCNVDQTPSWDSLELGKKVNSFQTLGRSARNTLGNVSMRLQKGRQSRADYLVSTPPKPSTPRKGSKAKKSTPTRTPRARTPTSGGGKRTPGGVGRAAGRGGKGGLLLRRSVRAAALKSPFASPTTAGRKRQFERDLDSVSRGIGQLKRLSQVFDEAIDKEERGRAIENYCRLMCNNALTCRGGKRWSRRRSEILPT